MFFASYSEFSTFHIIKMSAYLRSHVFRSIIHFIPSSFMRHVTSQQDTGHEEMVVLLLLLWGTSSFLWAPYKFLFSHIYIHFCERKQVKQP